MVTKKNKLLGVRIEDVNANKKMLHASYEVREQDGLHVRQIRVPLWFSDYPVHCTVNRTVNLHYLEEADEVDFGFGTIKVRGHIDVSDELVEPRVEKMTVAEIERKLGYKIEIVSEKE